MAGAAHELGDLRLVLQALLGAAELHAQGDEPRLGSVVQVALDAPQLGGLHVEGARAGARELVDARRELALLRAQAGESGDDDGVGAEGQGQCGNRPQRPERAAAREHVDHDEHPRDPDGGRAVERERAQAALRGAQREAHRELDGQRHGQREGDPLRPRVAGARQPPDEDEDQNQQQRQRGLDGERGVLDVIARAVGVHGHSVPGADALVFGARSRLILRLAAG